MPFERSIDIDTKLDLDIARMIYNKISNIILNEIVIDENDRVLPQSRFGYPIEDADPLMDRKEFLENMIIKPYKI